MPARKADHFIVVGAPSRYAEVAERAHGMTCRNHDARAAHVCGFALYPLHGSIDKRNYAVGRPRRPAGLADGLDRLHDVADGVVIYLQNLDREIPEAPLCSVVFRKHDHEVGLQPQDLLVIRIVISADLSFSQCHGGVGAVAGDPYDAVAEAERKEDLGDARSEGDDAMVAAALRLPLDEKLPLRRRCNALDVDEKDNENK